MNIAELKEFLATFPEEFDSYEIVNSEIGVLDEENYYRKDIPITTIFVDEDTQELVFAWDKRDLEEETEE